MLHILMKDGTNVKYNKDEFTDYEWKDKAFIVKKAEQWVGIYNWDCVECVEYI